MEKHNDVPKIEDRLKNLIETMKDKKLDEVVDDNEEFIDIKFKFRNKIEDDDMKTLLKSIVYIH